MAHRQPHRQKAQPPAPVRAGRSAASPTTPLDALTRVSQMIAGDLDLAALLRSAIHAAADAMNAEACSIMLQDAEREELRFHVVDGPQTGDLAELAVPVNDRSIAGWVAKHQQPALVPDAYQDSRFTPTYDERTGFRTRSVICVPLVAKSRPLGVIQLLNRRDGESFGEDDLELAKAVAGCIAVAIHNAEEHQARLKAERLATVGETIAGMAHCVRNILNGLRAGSYIIDQHLGGVAESRVVHGWQIVRRNMQRLSNIVLDMLSYSTDRRPVRAACAIGQVCEDVAALLRPQAREKGVTLTTSSTVETVQADETGLSRCLINLVANAIEACDPGGLVQVTVAAGPRPGQVTLSVRDTGCGMDETQRDRIFEAFYSTKGNRGTGLGLAVVRKIVSEHGGTIRVDSAPGRGTEFRLVLPAGDREAAP